MKRLDDRDTADTVQKLRVVLYVATPTLLFTIMVLVFLSWRDSISQGTILVGLLSIVPMTWILSLVISRGSDRGAKAFVNTLLAGSGSERKREYSEQESLQASGEHKAAAESFESHLVAYPDDHDARLRLAALQFKELGNADVAVALYSAVLESAPTRAQLREASDALVEIHRTRNDLTALRRGLARISRKFPGTTFGQGAARELAELAALDLDRTPDD